MKQTRLIMGMPITIEILDKDIDKTIFTKVFNHFRWVDKTFSPFKSNSELTRLNDKDKTYKITEHMQEIIRLSKQSYTLTNGYFQSNRNGKFDPTGLVKGWSIENASTIIKNEGFQNYYIDAGGDIVTSGLNKDGKSWKIGIRNPFDTNTIVKIIYLKDHAIATSGTYFRGNHIHSSKSISDVVSLTVIGPNILDADRFATAAFAMNEEALNFINSLEGLEGLMILKNKNVFFTKNFNEYTCQ